MQLYEVCEAEIRNGKICYQVSKSVHKKAYWVEGEFLVDITTVQCTVYILGISYRWIV